MYEKMLKYPHVFIPILYAYLQTYSRFSKALKCGLKTSRQQSRIQLVCIHVCVCVWSAQIEMMMAVLYGVKNLRFILEHTFGLGMRGNTAYLYAKYKLINWVVKMLRFTTTSALCEFSVSRFMAA